MYVNTMRGLEQICSFGRGFMFFSVARLPRQVQDHHAWKDDNKNHDHVEHSVSKARGLSIVTHTRENGFAKNLLEGDHHSLTHYCKSNPQKVARASRVVILESRVYI